MIPRTHLLAALLGLALIGAACGLVADQETLAEMTVTRISGTVTLVRDGTSRNVAGETDIEPGDQITTAAEGGRAELRLEGERRAELAPGSRIEVSSERGVTGLEGSVLAQPRSGDKLSVDFGEARALAGSGVFRVDLGLGTSRVGVYEGAASVSVPEQEPVTVDALWQADAAANARILSPSPLRISDQDPWDRIELGHVLDLDRQLERLGAGLATQLGGARPALGYFSSLADHNVGWLSAYLDERVPDLMIGFSIARTTDGELRRTFRRAHSLHRDGGRWGLVAEILEARERALVAQLGRSILSSGVLASDGAGEGPTFALAAEAGSGSAAPPASSTSSGGGGGNDPPPQGGNGPGDDDPEEDPCADPLANASECVEDLPPPVGGGSNDGDDDGGGGLIDGLLDAAGEILGGGD